MDLTISIVNYNTREMLMACLDAISKTSGTSALEVIVVDNGSSDGSPNAVDANYPEVKLLRNPNNRYFSAAHNQAIRTSTGRCVLIMNTDVLVFPGTLPALVDLLDRNPTAGAASCIFLDRDGKVRQTCWKFHTPKSFILDRRWAKIVLPNLPSRNEHRLADWDRLSQRDVDVVADAFMCVRRSALEQIGSYDERLLLYFTEDDICLRLRRSGWKVLHSPDIKVVHFQEYTSNRQSPLKIRWIRKRDTIAYFQKHNGWRQAFALDIILTLETVASIPLAYINWARRVRRGNIAGP